MSANNNDSEPFPRMSRKDAIAAACVALVVVIAGGVAFLTHLAWTFRQRGAEYVSAFTSLFGAAATVFTLAAAIVAAVYAALTYRLVQETAAHREAELMLRLLDEYDGLRADVRQLRSYFNDCAESGLDPLVRFRDSFEARGCSQWIVDDSRFKVSRFFVRVRKLSEAGYLSERVILSALDRDVTEQVFLALVDPLDKVTAGRQYGRADRDFFEALARRYPVRTDDGPDT